MRRVVVSSLVGVAGVVLFVAPAVGSTRSASNSETAKAPTAILADAKVAMNKAKPTEISGTVVTKGRRVSLDIVGAHGAGGGTISTDGERFQVVVTPPNVYLKADAATWTKITGTRVAGQLFANKWLQTTTASKDFASFGVLLDVSALTNQIFASRSVTKSAVTKFRGKRAIPLTDGRAILYVSATGVPYMLGIVGAGGNVGQVLFTQHRSAKLPTAPRNSINLSQLQQHAGISA